MAPIFVTTIPMPAYPSITRIFHYPTSTTPPFTPADSTETPLSSTALDILLVIVIVLALLSTFSIVWLCLRRRTRPPPSTEAAAVERDVTAVLKMIQSGRGRTHIIPKTWDSSHPFWMKRTMPSPDFITGAQTKMNETLLAEVPNVWRILGRSDVATEDSEPEYEQAIPTPRKAASQDPSAREHD
ncbi:hypothetical protein DFH07DRAFT_1056032 [Mycena maculata]|uniref:Uncharacterized protein n=1 Tax=Mycena maculata TaxID=230809 RepID=A0AAD7K5F2_9AGAR|nr:hypothetical protein DFH07DRAFT_1056032 [Mycena maculata]